jgi:membrane protein implicated in regulation of membrane protease activity
LNEQGIAAPDRSAGGQSRSRRPDVSVVARYVALQVPGWMLAALILLWIEANFAAPSWVLWLVGIAYVVKDIALFPLTWRAYAGEGAEGIRDPVGHLGVCSNRLAPRGSVHVRGETWHAISEDERTGIEAGSAVRIVGRDGLILRVRLENDVSRGKGFSSGSGAPERGCTRS